jgi:hypothetical protein
MLGDRWSLLIIRDMMLREFRTYKEFIEAGRLRDHHRGTGSIGRTEADLLVDRERN